MSCLFFLCYHTIGNFTAIAPIFRENNSIRLAIIQFAASCSLVYGMPNIQLGVWYSQLKYLQTALQFKFAPVKSQGIWSVQIMVKMLENIDIALNVRANHD